MNQKRNKIYWRELILIMFGCFNNVYNEGVDKNLNLKILKLSEYIIKIIRSVWFCFGK